MFCQNKCCNNSDCISKMDVILGFTFENAAPLSFGTKRLRVYTTLDCQSKIKDGF